MDGMRSKLKDRNRQFARGSAGRKDISSTPTLKCPAYPVLPELHLLGEKLVRTDEKRARTLAITQPIAKLGTIQTFTIGFRNKFFGEHG